jgi:putative methyltransferase (TIGR04325 family)
MSNQPALIPVVLFAYSRTTHLARVLRCLRDNRVPLLEVFADGARNSGDADRVAAARAMLRAIDWCEVRLVERKDNLGLGQNILAGVTEVAARHDAFIVWEDDLIATPGTYAWLSAVLRRYADDDRVMSVTGWTHPRITPARLGASPYFDGRAECWVWGTWARAWRGMVEENAREKLAQAAHRGIKPDAYGADLPPMARAEERQNIWAVRWLYHHLQHGGLCVRPPWSMVEHIGLDALATNAQHATAWTNPPLRAAPPIPEKWPQPTENPACRSLWRAANPSGLKGFWAKVLPMGRRILLRFLPRPVRRELRRLRFGSIYRGNFSNWGQAQAASRGYADTTILKKVIEATRAVRDGQALWERDTVLFNIPIANEPLLRALRSAAKANGGDLNVVDFGGALGSTWWQHRDWLEGITVSRWSIVEQPALVSAGQQEFSVGPLRFYPTMEECCANENPSVLLLSSVLPYLQDPHRFIAGIRSFPFRRVIIDRTGMVTRGPDRLTVQRVPPAIYAASYPCWFFDRAQLIENFGPDWVVTDEWTTDDAVDIDAQYRGFVLARKT